MKGIDFSNSAKWQDSTKPGTSFIKDRVNKLYAVIFEGKNGTNKFGCFLKRDGAPYDEEPIATIYGDEPLYLMSAIEQERLRYLLEREQR